ncbi:hypothetical protein D320_01458 [Haloferax sp. BAB-2207]|nr:immunoglobulin-like domain-containing protein [Haloferax sp. BAB-2207]ELK56027.1 hypothetical protein D320_01458 [Haloferax sp. BAB-2207]
MFDMNRRTFVTSLGIGGTALAGIGALKRRRESQPEYREGNRVVSTREDVQLQVTQEPIHLGDLVKYRVTNTGDSVHVLGCGNPWALEKQVEGDWKQVVWTGKRVPRMCATELSPGETFEERIELSKSGLEEHAEEGQTDLSPGLSRLLILGVSPILAAEFDVVETT